MYLPRIYLIAILLLALLVGANGQEQAQAVLVDAFGGISCEDLLGRHDFLLSELSKRPQDTGLAVVYSDSRNPNGFVKFLTANLFMRQIDRSRMTIVLVQGKGDGTSGTFWRIPFGAKTPSYQLIKEPPIDLSEPFLYGHDYSENVCPSFSPDLFAQLILDNPGSRARLVVKGPSWHWRQSTAAEELKSFEGHTKLPRNRIELYFVHRAGRAFTETEYWFLPAKRK